MGKKIATRLASIALTVAIPLSGVNVANASEASSTGTVTASQIAKSSEDSDMASEAADIENGLELIYSIPDQVLQQGDKATQEWLADHRPALQQRAQILGDVRLPLLSSWGPTLSARQNFSR